MSTNPPQNNLPGNGGPWDQQPVDNQGAQPQWGQQQWDQTPQQQWDQAPQQQWGQGPHGTYDPAAYGYGGVPQNPYAGQPGYGYAPAPQLASWGKRAQGWLLDWLLPNIVLNSIIMSLVPSARISTDPAASDYAQTSNWPSLVVFLITAVALSFLNKNGQTPGRKWAGTRLVDKDGQPVQAGGPSLGRYLLHIIDDFCFLGWLWPLWDSKRQTFADKIAKTYVVRDDSRPM